MTLDPWAPKIQPRKQCTNVFSAILFYRLSLHSRKDGCKIRKLCYYVKKLPKICQKVTNICFGNFLQLRIFFEISY